MTSTILLIRHAHTEMSGRFCGHIDPQLSKQGRRQLPELAKEMKKYPLTHIFSSDLLRAQETANFIAAETALTVEVLPGLRELSFGEWEGLNWDEVSKKDAAYAERWMAKYPHHPAPGGEEFKSFRERVRCSMTEVVRLTSEGCVAVISHGGVIRTFMLDVLDLPDSALAGLNCDYGSCIKVERRSGHWCL